MDARELAVVVVGLLGTYCLPWPAAELAGDGRGDAASPAQIEAFWPADSARGSQERPPPALLCETRN